MDILSYAGLRRSANVNTVYENSLTVSKVAKPFLCNLTTSGLCNSGTLNVVAGNYAEDPLYSIVCAMECLDSQSLARRRPNGIAASGLKIWDTTYSRCGICCAWTVPAGATCVQFQIWGAGGGTSGNCCCGGSPFGSSGAYATVTIPAVVGCVYTLCAGCAACCYATMATAGSGCQSFVTGFGLTSFCALGGSAAQCSWRNDTGCTSWNSNWPSVNSIGPCSCSGWNFCWDGTNDATCREYEYSRCSTFCGTATGSTVYGFRGIFPRLYLDNPSLLNGWTQAAPIMGYLGQSACRVDYNCISSPGNCGGCFGSTLYGPSGGFMLVPGQGAWPVTVSGGGSGTTFVGDAGRGGMVCVSWI